MIKAIVITGSSKGIGKYLSEQLLKDGYYVYGCSRGESTIDHKNYHHFEVNLNCEKSILNMFRVIRKSNNQLYGLINNAGVASMNHVVLTPTSTVEKLFNINFRATFVCSREASKIMKNFNTGRIINFSTIAVPISLEGESVYAASKAAVESFTKTLSKEVSNYGITVNLIGPNPIKTNLIKNVQDNKLKKVIDMQTIKRFGKFEDVLNIVNFYLSRNSDMITAQKIYLGGV